jgi:hypothetical protein
MIIPKVSGFRCQEGLVETLRNYGIQGFRD